MKTVIITGATKGIGLAIAERLLKENWHVIGLARQNKNNFPGEFLKCDLSDRSQTQKILNKLSEKGVLMDAIVNNVGVALPESLDSLNLTDLDKVYDLNVRTAVQITQHFLINMKQAGLGKIINIASRAIFGTKDRTSYSAAKSALIGCTKTWALELAEYGITVNAIAPGPVETELFRRTRPIGSDAERELLESIPMKRIGKPDEIAGGVAFLLSDDANFITGQTLCIDGGGSL